MMARNLLFALLLLPDLALCDFYNVSHLATAAIAFGSATTTGNDMYIPASAGNDLGMLESFDEGNTTTYISGVGVEIGCPILLAAAASKTTVLAGGLLAVGASRDFGKTFSKTPVAPLVPIGNKTVSSVTTQDIKFEVASGLFGLAGPINGLGSVAVSADDAETWTVKHIVTNPPLINPASIRYASFPSATTWYATAGFWGGDEEEAAQDDTDGGAATTHRLSKAFSVEKVDGVAKIVPNSGGKDKVIGDYNGAWTTVVKTTDGGDTWSVVYNATAPAGGLYPNDIHCFDEVSCAFVLDGSLSQPSQILTTSDGGATWTTFSTDQPSTLMPVRMVGKTEVWAAGGDTTGQMWHTIDLESWDKQSTKVTDAAFLSSFVIDPAVRGFAYATGFLRSQLCSALKIAF